MRPLSSDAQWSTDSSSLFPCAGLVIHALIGCSIIFFRPQLSQIPLAVLLGLFLFLGQSSLGGNQLVRDQRIVSLVASLIVWS